MDRDAKFVTILSIFVTIVVSAAFLPCVSSAYVIPEGGIDFGEVSVGDSKRLTVMIENTSEGVIFPHFELSQATFDAGHFWVTSLVELLQPGTQGEIQVHFEATAAGSCSTSLLIENGGTLLEEIAVTASVLDTRNTGTVVIGDIDTQIMDLDYEGAFISSAVDSCKENAKNHGDFVSCISQMADDLKKEGLITGKDAAVMKSAAARSECP